MFLNYLRLSLRLLARNPFFTFINVVGLAIGFTSFYALWEYSMMELKSDQYHKDADRIARVYLDLQWSDDNGKTWGRQVIGGISPSIMPAAKEDFQEVEATLRVLDQESFYPRLVNHGNKIVITINDQNGRGRVFKEERVSYADPNLFTFFTIPLVYGHPDKVLNGANFVVLSQSVAEKYFGKKDPIGELIKLNDSTTLIVSGVFENLPHSSHLNFELVISNVGRQHIWNETTGFSEMKSYVKLNDGALRSFEEKLNKRTTQYWARVLHEWPQGKLYMVVQPLEEVAFSQNFVGDHFYSRSKPFLITLAFIALSMLVMAWINYMNLSVTRASRRYKEIATRKISGAGTRDVIVQFVTEAVVTNVLAVALAFTLIQGIREPAFVLFNIHIEEFATLSSSSITILIVVVIIGIFLSGLYPAIVSISQQPVVMLKPVPSSGRRAMTSVLTVIQFVVAIVFILLGFTVSRQLNYVLNIGTGINKNEVVVIDAPIIRPANYSQVLNTFSDQIAAVPDVSAVTVSSSDVTDFLEMWNPTTKRVGSNLKFGMNGIAVDENCIPFYGIKLVAGRNFIKNNPTEEVILSRFAAVRLGFVEPGDAVGTRINIALVGVENWKEVDVIGVFENFRVTSFLNRSESSTEANDQGAGIVLMHKDQEFQNAILTVEKISIRISSHSAEDTMASIQSLFERQFPGNAFTWYFLDDHAGQVYALEKAGRNQIVLFMVLALIIACLGLLGMISSKVVEKTKEIGIRKVLGAEMPQVTKILLDQTMRHLILATLIGIPTSYYLTELYLEKFSERITLHWWHFTLPVAILILILFLTIAAVLLKAAKSNPVEALKYE